jgi:1-acyl-sn-glycerol-3-phosphate acyltransferase
LASIPHVGPQIPRAGGRLSRTLGAGALTLLGWRIDGVIPDVPKLVLIVAPHTSNWDFVIGIAAKLALQLRVMWLGKDSLFKGPLAGVMRALGGVPVDRATSHDVVRQVIDEFARREQMILGLAPEGTRKPVARWRTGFYHIAHGAGVPIVPIALNWGERAIQIGQAFETTGNLDADIDELRRRFSTVRGRRR